MDPLSNLLSNNLKWANHHSESNSDFFSKLVGQQAPEYLWIGCSDSRVPANEIVGLLPGELFVHRNVANLVIHTDLNCLSVLQYAVDFLKIKHVIVTGHYGCGGIKAAMESKAHGLVDNWLRHVRDTNRRYQEELDQISDYPQRLRRLCELNVVEQVINVGNTTVIQDAWSRGQNIDIHGWIYDISNGLVNDLNVGINSSKSLDDLQIQTTNSQTRRTIKLPIKNPKGMEK